MTIEHCTCTPAPRAIAFAWLLLTAHGCAAPCSDDGLRQYCDARVASSSGVAGDDDSTAAAIDSGVDATSATTGSSSAPHGSSSGGFADDSSSGGAPSSSDDAGGESSGGTVEVIDLSGYLVVQTASDRELELPADTWVLPGGRVIIARDATVDEFEDFWGVALDDDVVYLDGLDVLPVCNGDETFALVSPARALVDGPTPALVEETAMSRVDADLAGDDPAAWSSSDQPDEAASPGFVALVGGVSGAVVVSEVVDTVGVGAFRFEYVELFVIP